MANITFLEAGGASTGGTQLWDAVIGAWTVDTSVKPAGAYSSLAFAFTSSTTVSLSAVGVLSGANRTSFYFRTNQLPDGTRSLIRLISSGSTVGFLQQKTDGTLQWLDGNLTTFADGSVALAVDRWYRITLAFNSNGTSNNLDVNVYIDGVLDPSLNLTGRNTNGVSGVTQFDIRCNGAAGTRVIYFAHVYIDDGSDLTDPGNIQCTAKFPTTVNNNNWDTVIGTGAVNQRPLSEVDGVESLLATATTQDYALQAINEGDMNLTGLTLVGYLGWVWAKEVSVAGSPELRLNGTGYAITLTTSSAIYRQPVTSAAYPTNAAAIGMKSGTVATFMYECGVVVAFQAPEQVKLATLAFAGR